MMLPIEAEYSIAQLDKDNNISFLEKRYKFWLIFVMF